ncbi:putative glutamine amidotransferase protein [Rhizobium phage RHph_N3_19]|nr:putative glutamine amidotransferase protein [Rhizobium phage RHph_N3_19]
MCVIVCLSPGATMNKQQLFNAVYNNWHGYGLVLKDSNGHLQVLKGFDENGTNPEVVWKLLEDNKDIERYLHVRHSTKGAEDESNVQPFGVYSSNERQIYFMHNGTLTNFGTFNGGKSDTRDFCEKILEPSLLRWSGEHGKADYTDKEFFRLIVDKHWTGASTGLFVSNDLDMLRIGSGWSEYKHPDESSSGLVYVSNTSYFDRVQRGPMFQKLETERKEREAAEKARQASEKTSAGSGTSSSDLVDMDEWNGYPYNHYGYENQNSKSDFDKAGIKEWSPSAIAKSPKILKALNDVVNKFDLEDPDDIRKLNNVAYDEWVDFLDDESPYLIAALLEQMSSVISKLTLHNKFLRKKQERAEKKIVEFKMQSEKNDSQKVA